MRVWIVSALSLVGCGDESMIDLADATCPVSCDDGDPCTEDRCDVATGACLHVGRDALDACRGDNHCDDGDPCTIDTCVFTAECPELQRCQHTLNAQCLPCLEGGTSCYDDDPCTDDWCDDRSICHHDEVTRCEPRCDWKLALLPAQVESGEVAVMGTARVTSACVPGLCPCARPMVLGQSGVDLELTSAGEPLVCDATCAHATPCMMRPGHDYVVYGLAGDGRLEVEGFCLVPMGSNLDGDYAAILTLSDEPTPLRFTVHVGGFVPTVTDSTRVFTFGGTFRIEGPSLVLMSLSIDALPSTARLYVGADRLEGAVFAADVGRLGVLTLIPL